MYLRLIYDMRVVEQFHPHLPKMPHVYNNETLYISLGIRQIVCSEKDVYTILATCQMFKLTYFYF